MVQIEATFLIMKFGVIYKLNVDPTSKIDRTTDVLRLFLSSERLIDIRDKILLKYKGITLCPQNKLSWYLYSSGQIIEVYYPDTLPIFNDIDTSIIALRSTQALKEDGIEAVMTIQDELKNEPICLVRFFKILIAFIQYDPDLITEIQSTRDNDNVTLPEKLNFLYNKYRNSSKTESKDVLEHLILFITELLYQDPLISPEHVLTLSEQIYEKYLSMMLDILKRYHTTNLDLSILAAYSINYFLINKEKRYYILDSPTFRNIEEVLFESYDKELVLPLILATYNFLYMDPSAIFSEDVVQLFGTITNKILDCLADSDLAIIYLHLMALVYKEQSEASRYLYYIPKILSQLFILYFDVKKPVFTVIFKTLATMTRNCDVINSLLKNKTVLSTIMSSITLSGLSEEQYLYIIATLANLSSDKGTNTLLSTVFKNIVDLQDHVFTEYKTNSNLVMNYLCLINNLISNDKTYLSQFSATSLITCLHSFTSMAYTPLYLVKAIYNTYFILAHEDSVSTLLGSYYTNDRSIMLNNINTQAHSYADMDLYYYKKLQDMINTFNTVDSLKTPGDHVYQCQTIEESQIMGFFKQLPFPSNYINKKVENYQETLYFITFLLGEKKEKYQLYVPVDIHVSALQYLWPTRILKSVSIDNEIMNFDLPISTYIHENNKRVTVELETKSNIVVNAKIDSTKDVLNVNTSYEGTSDLNKNLANAAFKNAKEIIDNYKKEVDTDRREVLLHEPRIIKLGDEYVEVPWDFETEEEIKLRELKESHMKSDKEYAWNNNEHLQEDASFEAVEYKPESKPVAILKKHEPVEVVHVDPEIHRIEHRGEEDEFIKDLAPLPSIQDISMISTQSNRSNDNEYNTILTNNDISIETNNDSRTSHVGMSMKSVAVDPNLLADLNDLDIDIDTIDMDDIHEENQFILAEQTVVYISTITEQDPFVILSYLKLHQTQPYDCVELLKALVDKCISKTEESSTLLIYDQVILELFNVTYVKLAEVAFNYSNWCTFLYFISCLSQADNVFQVLMNEQYIGSIMNIITTIDSNKPANINDYLYSYVIPACYILYYLSNADNAELLDIYAKKGLGEYLTKIFKTKEIFSFRPTEDAESYTTAIDGITTVASDFIRYQAKTRFNIVYDWQYVINQLLKLTLEEDIRHFLEDLLNDIKSLH